MRTTIEVIERECSCGQGRATDYCEACGDTVCADCLEPAISPMGDYPLDCVCRGCRDDLWKVNEALKLYSHREEIVAGLEQIDERLGRATAAYGTNLNHDEYLRGIGEAIGCVQGEIIHLQCYCDLKVKNAQRKAG